MKNQEIKDSKPLKGIKVLDFTQFLAGPFCTMIMADMGAEVIKLEHPPLGDPTRFVYPGKGGLTTSFGSPNRGKKSVMMDLKDPRQKEIFFKMVKDADVVIDNFKPGTMEKLGVGYEVLKSVKPDIIMTEISGFGTTGPMKTRAAYDMIIQAYSGLISITGEKGGTPVRTGASMGDIVGGMGGCIATLLALYRRNQTGEGAYIDMAMLDTLLATLEAPIARYSINGIVPSPFGNRHPQSAPFQPFKVKGGSLVFIGCSTDEHWQKLCEIIGIPEVAFDERFLTMQARQENIEEMDKAISDVLINWEKEDLIKVLDDAKLVYGELQTIPEVIECEQVKARHMICEVEYYGRNTSLLSPASPFNISNVDRAEKSYVYPAGYHTMDVLKDYADPDALETIYGEMLKQSAELTEERIKKNGL